MKNISFTQMTQDCTIQSRQKLFLSNISTKSLRPHEPPHQYPELKINEIIEQETFPLQGFFENDDVEDDYVISIDAKIAVAVDYENVCEEVTQYIYPRWGENKNGRYFLH